MNSINADSAWDEGQKSMSDVFKSKVELEIPDVLYVSQEGNDYFIYVNVEDNWHKITNMEDTSDGGRDFIRKNYREKHTEISK